MAEDVVSCLGYETKSFYDIIKAEFEGFPIELKEQDIIILINRFTLLREHVSEQFKGVIDLLKVDDSCHTNIGTIVKSVQVASVLLNKSKSGLENALKTQRVKVNVESSMRQLLRNNFITSIVFVCVYVSRILEKIKHLPYDPPNIVRIQKLITVAKDVCMQFHDFDIFRFNYMERLFSAEISIQKHISSLRNRLFIDFDPHNFKVFSDYKLHLQPSNKAVLSYLKELEFWCDNYLECNVISEVSYLENYSKLIGDFEAILGSYKALCAHLQETGVVCEELAEYEQIISTRLLESLVVDLSSQIEFPSLLVFRDAVKILSQLFSFCNKASLRPGGYGNVTKFLTKTLDSFMLKNGSGVIQFMKELLLQGNWQVSGSIALEIKEKSTDMVSVLLDTASCTDMELEEIIQLATNWETSKKAGNLVFVTTETLKLVNLTVSRLVIIFLLSKRFYEITDKTEFNTKSDLPVLLQKILLRIVEICILNIYQVYRLVLSNYEKSDFPEVDSRMSSFSETMMMYEPIVLSFCGNEMENFDNITRNSVFENPYSLIVPMESALNTFQILKYYLDNYLEFVDTANARKLLTLQDPFLTYCSNCLISRTFNSKSVITNIYQTNFNIKEIKAQHSGYVDNTVNEVAGIIENVKAFNDFNITGLIIPKLWESCANVISCAFTDGFSSIQKCTNEGRALMQLDFQQCITSMNKQYPCKNLFNIEKVETLIKLYYFPEDAFCDFISQPANRRKYSRKQIQNLILLVSKKNKNFQNKAFSIINTN